MFQLMTGVSSSITQDSQEPPAMSGSVRRSLGFRAHPGRGPAAANRKPLLSRTCEMRLGAPNECFLAPQSEIVCRRAGFATAVVPGAA
jgi:hypothetical protein